MQQPQTLAERIEHALRTTARAGHVDARDGLFPEAVNRHLGDGPGAGHRYDSSCALCAGDVSALAAALEALVQPELDEARAEIAITVTAAERAIKAEAQAVRDLEAEVGRLREQLAARRDQVLVMAAPAIRETLLHVISFAECCNEGTTPDELLDAYRDQVLTEAAELVLAQRAAVYNDAGRRTAEGLDRARDILLDARTGPARQEPAPAAATALGDWAADMDRAGLQPYDGGFTLDADGTPFVRLYLAFADGVEEDTRAGFLMRLARAVLNDDAARRRP
ncbi:hypothetical protein [Kitasatospora sp. NPDC059571]|uniref:hypothetical protein n=1 Tax=Kitasatospora sp. NPDC059571 TaxID=3346871 RepID=UPI0036B9FD6D